MPDEPQTNETEKPLALVENGRTDEQREHMKTVNETGVCPFCQIDLKINTILKETDYWRLLLNAYPYHHHSHHLVLIPKRHVTDITDLTGDEWYDWGLLNKWAIEKFNLPGGGLVFRFGGFMHSGATLSHLHSHIQVPDGTGPALAVFYKDEFFQQFLTELHTKALSQKTKP